jgi:hypothetical protein
MFLRDASGKLVRDFHGKLIMMPAATVFRVGTWRANSPDVPWVPR